MVHGGSSIVKYILQTADGTSCRRCGNREVYMLCPEDVAFTFPAFYICLECHFIGQIGVGEVPYESKFDMPDGNAGKKEVGDVQYKG